MSTVRLIKPFRVRLKGIPTGTFRHSLWTQCRHRTLIINYLSMKLEKSWETEKVRYVRPDEPEPSCKSYPRSWACLDGDDASAAAWVLEWTPGFPQAVCGHHLASSHFLINVLRLRWPNVVGNFWTYTGHPHCAVFTVPHLGNMMCETTWAVSGPSSHVPVHITGGVFPQRVRTVVLVHSRYTKYSCMLKMSARFTERTVTCTPT